jgi:hypothetical protein
VYNVLALIFMLKICYVTLTLAFIVINSSSLNFSEGNSLKTNRPIANEIITTNSNDASALAHNTTTFQTKRLWVYVSSETFLPKSGSLFVKIKGNFLSTESDYQELSHYETPWNAIFYYFDMPLSAYCFQIASRNPATNTTNDFCEWVYRAEPTFIYEITNDVSAKIRQRNLNIGWGKRPDAVTIGLLLSSFCSFSPLYENGYGAYSSLKENWLQYYRGDKETLSATNIFDYTESEFEAQQPKEKKTRLISLDKKIEELKEAYESKKPENKKSNSFDVAFEMVTLILTFLASLLIVFLLNKSVKKK